MDPSVLLRREDRRLGRHQGGSYSSTTVSLHVTQAEQIGVPGWGGGGTTELKSDMGRRGTGTGKGKTNPK